MKVTGKILEEKFDEYNMLYFNNNLIKPKFSTYISEHSMGRFNVSEKKNKFKKTISIIRNVNFMEKDFRDILVHEMIHLYVYDTYGKGHSHDEFFNRKMKELNKSYGLDIRKNSNHLFRKYFPKISFLRKIKNFII